MAKNRICALNWVEYEKKVRNGGRREVQGGQENQATKLDS